MEILTVQHVSILLCTVYSANYTAYIKTVREVSLQSIKLAISVIASHREAV